MAVKIIRVFVIDWNNGTLALALDRHFRCQNVGLAVTIHFPELYMKQSELNFSRFLAICVSIINDWFG